MEDQTKDIKDYINAFKRHKKAMLAITLLVLTTGLLIAHLLPAAYRSSATILIEEQEIPPELARSTVTSYAAKRIQIISQRVMTRQNLMEIIKKFDLYADRRKKETTEEITARVRKNIALDMINAKVIDPRSGSPTSAMIAFTVGFEGEDPGVVQKVANELTTLYLNENVKTRTQEAEDTYSYLAEESKELSDRIAELDKQLANFKNDNRTQLPELKALNQQLLSRTEDELLDLKNNESMVHDRIAYFKGQLAQIPPYGGEEDGATSATDPATRLAHLRRALKSMQARYQNKHPELLSVKREIAGLESELGISSTDEVDISERLEALRQQLRFAQERYSDQHPDVVRLKREISALEQTIPVPSDKISDAHMEESRPTNPAYISLQENIEMSHFNLKNIDIKRAQLQTKLEEYEKRLTNTPQVEMEGAALSRKYTETINKYKELKAKLRVAEVGQKLEEEQRGERFSLIDPPARPEEPISPNRGAIRAISLVLAVASGFGYAVMMMTLDTSVRGAKGIIALVDVPPLAVLPRQANPGAKDRKRKKIVMGVSAAIAAIILIIASTHLFWKPLDVLWFKSVRKVDNIVN